MICCCLFHSYIFFFCFSVKQNFSVSFIMATVFVFLVSYFDTYVCHRFVSKNFFFVVFLFFQQISNDDFRFRFGLDRFYDNQHAKKTAAAAAAEMFFTTGYSSKSKIKIKNSKFIHLQIHTHTHSNKHEYKIDGCCCCCCFLFVVAAVFLVHCLLIGQPKEKQKQKRTMIIDVDQWCDCHIKK